MIRFRFCFCNSKFIRDDNSFFIEFLTSYRVDSERNVNRKDVARVYLVFLVLFEVLAGLLFENERRAREGGRTVPGQRRTRRTRRGHRQGIEVTIQEIPIAATVVVIAGTEFNVVQTERIPFVRRRHLVYKEESFDFFKNHLARSIEIFRDLR